MAELNVPRSGWLAVPLSTVPWHLVTHRGRWPLRTALLLQVRHPGEEGGHGLLYLL